MTTKKTNNSFSNPWFAACLGLLGIIIGYSVANMNPTTVQVAQAPTPAAPTAPAAPTPTPEPPAPSVVAAPDDNDYFRGDRDAEITLIEYSDFQCPFCTRHHPTMAALVENNPGTVNWIYRHLPLRSIHPGAQKAGEAAECAGDLGGTDAFWAATDAIFEDSSLATNFAGLADKVGLDSAAFVDCVETGKFADAVDEDLASASAAGVRGTPGTIIYNNKTEESSLVSGARGEADIQAIIDNLLSN
jgi:protein-disulfide isomerase